MKIYEVLSRFPTAESVTMDADDNVTCVRLRAASSIKPDDPAVTAALLNPHIRQEDTASGAGPEDDAVRRVRNVLESLLIGNLGRDDAEHRILRIFNEHVDLNRRAIHPDVEAVLIPEVAPISLGPVVEYGPVVGYVQVGRMFHLDGQPLRPVDQPEEQRYLTAIAVDRPKRKMVDRPQA